MPSILFSGEKYNLFGITQALSRLTLNSHKSLLSRYTAEYISDNHKHRVCSKVIIDKILPFSQPGTLKLYILCPRRQQPTRDDHAVRVQWFSSAAFDMNELIFSCYAGDMHGLPIMFLNDYIP